MPEAQQQRLRGIYPVLAQRLQPEGSSGNGALLLALAGRLVSPHCLNLEQYGLSLSAVARACAKDYTAAIDQAIDELESQFRAENTMVALPQAQYIFAAFRLMLSRAQLQRLKAVFLKLTPQLFEQITFESDPRRAISFLRCHFFPYVELLAPGGSRQQTDPVIAAVQSRLPELLHSCLDAEQDRLLPGSSTVYLMALVDYLRKYHCLLPEAAQDLREHINLQADKRRDQRGRTLAKEITRQLLSGQSRGALALCLRTCHQQPTIWNGVHAATFNHRLKCALRAELISLCYNIGTEGQLTLDHCKWLNQIFSQLHGSRSASVGVMLWELPWIIGRVNCCTLFALRNLLINQVLQPRWEQLSAGECCESTLVQLRGMLSQYHELISREHIQQVDALESQLRQQQVPVIAPPAASEAVAVATVETQTSTAPAVPTLAAETQTITAPAVQTQAAETQTVVSTGQTGGPESAIAEAPPVDQEDTTMAVDVVAQSAVPELNFTQLNAMLRSRHRAQAFYEQIIQSGAACEEQAKAWLDLLQRYCSEEPVPIEWEPEMRLVVSGIIRVVSLSALNKINACGLHQQRRQQACQQVADYLVQHVCPLDQLCDRPSRQIYDGLLSILYGVYLKPISRAVSESGPENMSGNRDILWQNCCQAHPYVMLYQENVRRCLRAAYTRYFTGDLERIRQDLASGNALKFAQGAQEVITRVLEMHNFYSWEQTPLLCQRARDVADFAYDELAEKAAIYPDGWLALLMEFELKYLHAGFLRID